MATKVIAHGTVATDYGVFRAHIVIKDGRIAHLTDDDAALRVLAAMLVRLGGAGDAATCLV